MNENKIFYLDKNNNIVEKEESVKSVIQVYENGQLVNEVWSYKNINKDEVVEEMECVYVNQDGNVVSQEEATHVIYKTLKDGKVISEDKFELGKFTPKL